MLSILKKPKADVTLDISGEPFYPGGTINVGIFISSQDRFTVRSGTVELVCTEVYWKVVSDGKSTRKQKFKRKLFKLKEEFLTNTEFSSGMALNETASVTLPSNVAPTVIGKTVNISWQLDVKLDVPKMRDIHEKRAITVLPMATAIPVSEESGFAPSNRVTNSSDEGDLTLTLDSGYASAGDTLRGSFEAVIQKDVSVEGIRVELEVKEKAGAKSSSTTVDLVQLEQKSSLAAGAYKQWKFTLKLPDTPLPTFHTSDSSVQWRVKGILNKRRKKDFSVDYPIQVY